MRPGTDGRARMTRSQGKPAAFGAHATSVVTVVVVSWNTRDVTLRCLETLRASLHDVPAQVVVVDNGSSDGSADAIAAAYPDVRLLRSDTNKGFAGGVNHGLSVVATDYVVLLNSDAVVLEGAVQHLVEELSRHPDVAIVGGRQFDPDGRFVPTGHRFPSILHDLATAPGIHQIGRLLLDRGGSAAGLFFATQPQDVDWLSYAFVAFRSRVVDEVGMLPEEFFMYGEDIEWCWRVRRHGWRIRYAGGPGIVHEGGRSSESLPSHDRHLRILDALFVFAQRHRNPLAWRIGWLLRWAFLRTRALLRRGRFAVGWSRTARADTPLLDACARRARDQLTGRYRVPLDSAGAPDEAGA